MLWAWKITSRDEITMIRDGQSLAEASATLFKDILLGQDDKQQQQRKIRNSSCIHCSSCEYPTSLPPSLRLQDIQFHLLPKGGQPRRHFCCPPKSTPLRRNNSLVSLWNNSAWGDDGTEVIVNKSRRGVISGVPGLRSSIHNNPPLVLVNNHNHNNAPVKKHPKVTFKLPESNTAVCSNSSCCCFYCYCCPCCAFDLLQYDPPNLPPKADKKHRGGGHKKDSDTTHYVSPSPRDGDYSYAYDSSVSPAFLIKWQNARENLYEEIVDVREEMKKLEESNQNGPVGESNSDSGIGNLVLSGSLGTLDVKKSIVQRANSFSSRDNNYNISTGSRSNSLKVTSSPDDSKPISSTTSCCANPGTCCGQSRRRDSPSHHHSTNPSDQKIKGLFKRVLHKWSHC